MSDSRADLPARGLTSGVVVAALATGAGMAPGLVGFSGDTFPTGALRGLGWPAFGVVAALLLDRDPTSRLGRSFLLLAALPAVVAIVAVAMPGDPVAWSRIDRLWHVLGITPVLVALAVIAWGVDRAAERMARRRLVWLVVWSSVLVAAIVVAGLTAGPRVSALVTSLGLWGMAAVVYRLVTTRDLRPVDEPLIDLAIAGATIVCGAVVGTLIRTGAARVHMPGPDLSGAFAAVVITGIVLPAGLWARRSFLAHRYGRGTLTATDVAQITADLHTLTDARDLLGKAAAMVGAASGHRQVSIVLGPDVPDVPPHWELYALIVGGDRVGTVLLEPAHPEGSEPRQQRIVAQLLPTVALVARAVSLAVEADHARRDVARQRDAERARILGDLHDGLGPVLAGMGMRVRAEMRREPSPVLESLAGDLAACRTDLRRIVSGLTPSVLQDGDLATALTRLVGSFDGHGPAVVLDVRLDGDLPAEVAVAVYRSVAEGVTNALRHARAERVTVSVRGTADGRVAVDVGDDGVGGPIVWGVGLSSLRRRAAELGGVLDVAAHGTGTRLTVELPARTVPA